MKGEHVVMYLSLLPWKAHVLNHRMTTLIWVDGYIQAEMALFVEAHDVAQEHKWNKLTTQWRHWPSIVSVPYTDFKDTQGRLGPIVGWKEI